VSQIEIWVSVPAASAGPTENPIKADPLIATALGLVKIICLSPRYIWQGANQTKIRRLRFSRLTWISDRGRKSCSDRHMLPLAATSFAMESRHVPNYLSKLEAERFQAVDREAVAIPGICLRIQVPGQQ
jgi:hypothetical protein